MAPKEKSVVRESSQTSKKKDKVTPPQVNLPNTFHNQ